MLGFNKSLVLLAAALALPAAAHAQTKITVGIPTSPPNIVHMPVIVAKELGLYKKAGLDVDIVSLGDGVKVYRALLAGNIEFGLTPGAPTIIGRSNGAAVKALSANLPKFEASMVVRADIKTMADLKGKRIGIQEPGGFADILSRSVLRSAKIDPKDVNFVTIASEDVPALVANQVDTAILHVEQEMFAKSKVPDLHAIARMWELQPKTLYTFLSATEKTIKEKPRDRPGDGYGQYRGHPRSCIPTGPRSFRSLSSRPAIRKKYWPKVSTFWSSSASGMPIAASAPSA